MENRRSPLDFRIRFVEAFVRAFPHRQSAGGRQLQVLSAPATAPPHSKHSEGKGQAKPAPKGKYLFSSPPAFLFKITAIFFMWTFVLTIREKVQRNEIMKVDRASDRPSWFHFVEIFSRTLLCEWQIPHAGNGSSLSDARRQLKDIGIEQRVTGVVWDEGSQAFEATGASKRCTREVTTGAFQARNERIPYPRRGSSLSPHKGL